MERADERRDLKVSLPVQQHIHLRALKILTGETLSKITEDALDRYLDDRSLDDRFPHLFDEI